MERYLIFGGTGSLGKKLMERFTSSGNKVAAYSRDEAKHWTIRNALPTERKDLVDFFVGDIRDASRVRSIIRQFRPTTIIIAAALKHVDTCESSPSESVSTNVVGTQNVIDAVNDLSDHDPLQSVLFVSTDKACAPTNVYGMCKALSERIVLSQDMTGNRNVKFIAVRYGNVLESRGSIIPLFKYQSESSSVDQITVTDPNMTRFVMTLDDSVDLISDALVHGKGGHTWIPRLPSMRIGDLAEIFSKASGKSIKVIGIKPGEKLHEDLINETESIRTEQNERRYVIRNVFSPGTPRSQFRYTSADEVMSKTQLETHLNALGIIQKSLDSFHGLSIEEIKTQ